MALTRFLVHRLVRLIATVFLISTVVFVLVRVIPGDPALVVAGVDATEGEIENIRRRLGTDASLPEQYGRWLWGVVRLDFGTSYITDQPVRSLIAQRFPLTLSLALLGFLASLLISVPIGVFSAVRRWTGWDMAGMLYSQVGMAIPSFWLGILLILGFSVRLQWFPMFGDPTLARLVLPALSLAIGRSAFLVRMVRASVIEELDKEYVLTAEAKGLLQRTIRYEHVLKNALLPVITLAALQLGYMLGGSIIIEQVFSLPGLGRLFLTGIYQRDFPLIQAGVVFFAVVFSLINFAADALYSVVNPRIRIG
jgi:peptide/nickel transport system permease protein